MAEEVPLEVAIEVVLRNGPTFETIAGLCKMAADAERNKLAQWMIRFGFATGHGDTMEQLCDALGTEIADSIDFAVDVEREQCARVAQDTVCDTHLPTGVKIYGTKVAAAIRARNDSVDT